MSGPDDDRPVRRQGSEARQGAISGRIVTVLAVSILLVVAGFLLAWLFAGSSPNSP